MNSNILVSCTVVSYNSAKTILDTLESIKAQTYHNIELIVSDDCSKDDTVNICQEWMEKNKNRFVRTVLLTVEKNTGIPANCNRIWKACQGLWKKGCAADDIMLPNCIQDYIDFVQEHPEARWVVSRYKKFKETFDDENCFSKNYVSTRELYELSAEEQLKQISKTNTIPAITLFCQLSLIKELGGYDLSYFFEDYPFNIKVLEHGYRCYFMDKETMGYRFHDSVSQSKDELFRTSLLNDCRRFQKEHCFKHLTNKQVKGVLTQWKYQDFLIRLHLNRRTPVVAKLYYAGLKVINSCFDL